MAYRIATRCAHGRRVHAQPVELGIHEPTQQNADGRLGGEPADYACLLVFRRGVSNVASVNARPIFVFVLDHLSNIFCHGQGEDEEEDDDDDATVESSNLAVKAVRSTKLLPATWGCRAPFAFGQSVICAVLSRVGLRRLKHEAGYADTDCH